MVARRAARVDPVFVAAPEVTIAAPVEPPLRVTVVSEKPTPRGEPVAAPETAPDFSARYLDNPAPAYPMASRRLREQGRVMLRVLVSALGHAEEIHVVASSGHPRPDDAAVDTGRRWRFVPAPRGAQSISAWVVVPVSFRVEG